MRGLYAISDVATLADRGIDVIDFSRAVLAARPAALQLRAKGVPPREILSLLRVLLPISRHAGVPLVINDRVDVAALAGTDCVHVGQDDMPIESVRRIAPGLRVGISTHSLEQLARALEHRPAYVALGPIYATSSKVDADPVVGLATLRVAHAMARAAGVPLVAIGGITLERAPDLADATDAAAVIAALLPSEGGDLAEVTLRARRLDAALTAHPVATQRSLEAPG
jgi:thiamine-phosphate pyrophosphorylase